MSVVEHSVLDHSPSLRAATVRHGLRCVDTVWKGWDKRYRFVCRQDHVFLKTPNALIHPQATGCPACREASRIQRMQDAAAACGAICLDTQWKGYVHAYRFRCAEGHEWQRQSRKVVVKAGCPVCAYKRSGERKQLQDGLSQLKAAATERGGACLADRYEGGAARYSFRCVAGHTWSSVGYEVLRGNWCQRCANDAKRQAYLRQDGMQRLCETAIAHGGVCLDHDYLGSAHRYQFRCREGHVWKSTGNRILRGAWCLKCSRIASRLGIEVAHQVAADRGGQCLSEVYVDVRTKMAWLCHRGHAWQAPLANIRAGHWCPQCAIMARITNPNSKKMLRYIASTAK